MSIPVIDLHGFVGGDAEHRLDIAKQTDRACREVGFFSVVGHGVADSVIDDAHRGGLEFFDLSLEDRSTAIKPDPTYPYGYSPFSVEALNRSIGGVAPPDLKETYNVGPVDAPPRSLDDMVDDDERSIWSPTLWPTSMPELRPVLERYSRAMADLAATIMDVFGVALGRGSGWFEPFIDHHTSALRIAHYPPLSAAPEPGTFRAGAHSDYGTLTILRLDAEPGLQVQGRDGEWSDVNAPAGALVINLGDLMQRWSNDRWRSTLHRVVVPGGRYDTRRLTMPFFHNANWDAHIECIVADGDVAHHEPVVAGEHLLAKFRASVT